MPMNVRSCHSLCKFFQWVIPSSLHWIVILSEVYISNCYNHREYWDWYILKIYLPLFYNVIQHIFMVIITYITYRLCAVVYATGYNFLSRFVQDLSTSFDWNYLNSVSCLLARVQWEVRVSCFESEILSVSCWWKSGFDLIGSKFMSLFWQASLCIVADGYLISLLYFRVIQFYIMFLLIQIV